ncbi:unnamed protein product [Effrenium voratum]|nr:unnamed protein product [Effrenium voratum]
MATVLSAAMRASLLEADLLQRARLRPSAPRATRWAEFLGGIGAASLSATQACTLLTPPFMVVVPEGGAMGSVDSPIGRTSVHQGEGVEAVELAHLGFGAPRPASEIRFAALRLDLSPSFYRLETDPSLDQLHLSPSCLLLDLSPSSLSAGAQARLVPAHVGGTFAACDVFPWLLARPAGVGGRGMGFVWGRLPARGRLLLAPQWGVNGHRPWRWMNDGLLGSARLLAALAPGLRRQWRDPPSGCIAPCRDAPKLWPPRRWTSHASMRCHLNEHCAGRLAGAVPPAYLQQQRLTQCQVCHRLLAARFGDACPRCRPELTQPQAAAGRPLDPGCPSLEECFLKRVPTKPVVPKEAHALWSQCLLLALSQVVRFNDERAWLELFMLPKAVLRTQGRGQSFQAPPGPAPEEISQRVCRLVEQGQLQKACNALTQPAAVEATPEIFQEMLRKHPAPRAALDWARLRPVHGAAAPTITPDMVQRAVRSFPNGSAGGPTGLKPQHLLDAQAPGHTDELFRLLALVAKELARGSAPPAVRQLLSGASLVALPKQGGGHRPIAVGEVLRRVVGKCLAAEVRDQARQHLEPRQVGVGTPAGAEAVVHTVRQWVRRHRRDAGWIWRTPSTRLTGVQQGDPLGPLFFSLALDLAVDRAFQRLERESVGCLDLAVFYLDDATLAGPAPAVARACLLLAEELAGIGLRINTSKSEAVPTAPSLHGGQGHQHLFPTFQWRASGDFELLGAPVGTDAFCGQHTEQRCADAAPLLDKLGALDDPQVALQLLRHCAGFCKVAYSARAVPPHQHVPALERFDERVRHAFVNCTGVPLYEGAWRRATRGVLHGGLGLRSAARHAHAAYVASLLGARGLAGRVDAAWEAEGLPALATLQRALEELNANLLPAARLPWPCEERPRQQALSRKLDRACLDAELATADAATKAHLRLVASDGAGAWLHTLPTTDPATRFGPELFRIALRRRLRVPVQEQDTPCVACGRAMDAWGDHALVCSCRGDRTLRHNALWDLVCWIAKRAGCQPEKEKAGLLPGRCHHWAPASSDIYLPRGREGQPVCWDFAVTSGLQAQDLHGSAAGAESVAARYEQRKRAHLGTEDLCRSSGLQYVPVVLEAHGGSWGPAAKKAFAWLSQAWGAAEGLSGGQAAEQLAQRISLSLHRENARAVVRRLVLPEPGHADSGPLWPPFAADDDPL